VRILSINGGKGGGTKEKRSTGHNRMLSRVVEAVEEGEYVELSAVGASRGGTPRSEHGGFGRRKAT